MCIYTALYAQNVYFSFSWVKVSEHSVIYLLKCQTHKLYRLFVYYADYMSHQLKRNKVIRFALFNEIRQ